MKSIVLGVCFITPFIAGVAMLPAMKKKALPPESSYSNKLVGEWEITSCVTQRREVPNEVVRRLKMRFTDRLLINSPALAEKANMSFSEMSQIIDGRMRPRRVETVFCVDEVGTTALYQIDPTKTPHQIDLILKTENVSEQRLKGIFTASGHKALLCVGTNDRPTDFTAPEDGFLMTLRRLQP